jgi:hypothetical protein
VLSAVHTRRKLPQPHPRTGRARAAACRPPRAYAASPAIRWKRWSRLVLMGCAELRDASLLLVGFDSRGRRVREIAGMVVERLRYRPSGGRRNSSLTLCRAGRNRGDQTANRNDRLKPIKGPAAALRRGRREEPGSGPARRMTPWRKPVRPVLLNAMRGPARGAIGHYSSDSRRRARRAYGTPQPGS